MNRVPPHPPYSRRPLRQQMRRALRLFQLPPLAAALSLLLGCSPIAAQTADPARVDRWQTVATGIERQTFAPGGEYAFTQLVALRLDPAAYQFRVHYQPSEPLRLAGWRALLPDATLIVNANFFSPSGEALGLLIADGVLFHSAFVDFGGTFAVENGVPSVRSNIAYPYAGDAYEHAAQGFPMLISDGAASYTTTRNDRPSRRMVIAQDSAGHIVVIATTSLFGMRLADLAAYLAARDLGLVNAVNLDGGGSTLLSLRVPGTALDVVSIDPVPAVIAAYPVTE